MPNEITVYFAPCEPAPIEGYRIKYRPVGGGPYLTWPVNFPGSPAVFNDGGEQPDGTFYEGTVEADCGNGIFGTPVVWQNRVYGNVALDLCTGADQITGARFNGQPLLNLGGSYPIAAGDSTTLATSETGAHLLEVDVAGSPVTAGSLVLTDSEGTEHCRSFTGAGTLSFAGFVLQYGRPWSALLQCVPCEGESDSPLPCEAVAFTEGTIPDGTEGDAYSVDLHLTGDGPFALDSVVKPSWMTVTLVGATVQLRGTPDAAGIDEELTIEASNCDGLHTDVFSDTMDVAAAGATGEIRALGCLDTGQILDVQLDGVSVPLASGSFPLSAGDIAFTDLIPPGVHTLSVSVSGLAGSIRVTDSTPTTHCTDYAGADIYDFPLFSIGNSTWFVTLDCGACT